MSFADLYTQAMELRDAVSLEGKARYITANDETDEITVWEVDDPMGRPLYTDNAVAIRVFREEPDVPHTT